MARATNRLLRSISLHAGARSFAIVERRGKQHALVLVVTLVLVGVWFAISGGEGAGRNIFLGGVLALAWLVVAWLALPWNARVVIDADERTCRVLWRFFLFPLRSRTVDIGERTLAFGEGILLYEKQVEAGGVDPAGCFVGLLLGPLLGMLLSGKTEKVTVRELQHGLILRSGSAESGDLLLAVTDRESVEDALTVIGQLAPELV